MPSNFIKLVLIYACTSVMIAAAGEGLWLLTMEHKQQPQWFVLGIGILFLGSGIWISRVWHSLHEPKLKIENQIIESKLEDFAHLNRLSKSEIEVLELLLLGHRNAEIAEARHVSLNTIKTHLASIYSKTGVASRSKLIFLIKSEKQ
jgi:DNA-binding CsgD family transcriptional regulator